MRVWNKNNGVLAHQLPISEQKSEIQAIHVTNQRLHVASGRTLVVFRLGDEKPVETVISKTELLVLARKLLKTRYFPLSRTFSAFFQQDDVVIHVSALKNAGKSIELSKITEDGAFEPLKTVEIKDFEPKK